MRKVTETRARNIREQLFRLVQDRLIELECNSLVEFARRRPQGARRDVALFEGDLCPLVNVLCPEDLCYLPAGHVGTQEGFHITSTVAYDYAVQWQHNDSMPVGTSRAKLVQRGADLQVRMRLDEIDGMG